MGMGVGANSRGRVMIVESPTPKETSEGHERGLFTLRCQADI